MDHKFNLEIKPDTQVALALKTIGEAILFPGHRIPIISKTKTGSANRELRNTIYDIIVILRLKGFVIGHGNNTLSYIVEN